MYSLDSDEAWIKTLRKKFLSAAHQIYMRMETDWNQKKPPGLMFIDGTEGERVHDVRIAKAWQVPIVVVHDTEDEQAASYNWDGCLDGWKYRYDYVCPPFAERTTVLSDSVDVVKLFGSCGPRKE